MSEQPDGAEDRIRMSPEEEREAVEAATEDESTEPADEGVGVHTDAEGDDHYTEN